MHADRKMSLILSRFLRNDISHAFGLHAILFSHKIIVMNSFWPNTLMFYIQWTSNKDYQLVFSIHSNFIHKKHTKYTG